MRYFTAAPLHLKTDNLSYSFDTIKKISVSMIKYVTDVVHLKIILFSFLKNIVA
jgi:hypothetical protein